MPPDENTRLIIYLTKANIELAQRLRDETRRADELYAEVVKWKQAYQDAKNLATTAIAIAKDKE